MAERPILFSAPMVRALLAGTKTQTRRAVKPAPSDAQWIEQRDDGFYLCADGEPTCYTGVWETHEYAHVSPIRCPYGQPGDRLWVRENGWQRPERTPKMMREGADTWAPYYFDADGISDQEAADFKAWGFKRRPSIHMPRTACRLVLEVTGVRVERLQAISAEDAAAEGMSPADRAAHNEIGWYRQLWIALNGAASWHANPWVWVVEFRKHEQ